MKIRSNPVIFYLVLIFTLISISGALAKVDTLNFGAFSFTLEIRLPGNPQQVFDAITGDISGWWDHTFSEEPAKFYIEPKPGGGFWEIFDDEGNGVKHATVIAADRGKLLRFDGPLGLSGRAVQMVTTYTFEPVEADSTRLNVEIHLAGETEENLPQIVEKVWHHFIFERFVPYMHNRQTGPK